MEHQRSPFRHFDKMRTIPSYLHQRLQRLRRGRDSKPNNGFFAVLPNELIGIIANFLPKPVAACLALTNKRMLYILGLSRLTDLTDELSLFLSYLERDHPRCRLCHYCQKLHTVTGNECPRYNGRIMQRNGTVRGWAPSCRPDDRQYLGLSYFLYWDHVQLAMRRYRRGVDHGISLGQFTYDGKLRRSFLYPPYQRMEMSARIINGELYLRQIYSTYISSANRKVNPKVELIERIIICPHIQTTFVYDVKVQKLLYQANPLDTHILRLTNQNVGRGGRGGCESVKQCSGCHTEYRVDKIGAEKIMITAWYNYGTGESPWDPKWQLHGAKGRKPAEDTGLNFVAGSIYGAWIGQDKRGRRRYLTFSS